MAYPQLVINALSTLHLLQAEEILYPCALYALYLRECYIGIMLYGRIIELGVVTCREQVIAVLVGYKAAARMLQAGIARLTLPPVGL